MDMMGEIYGTVSEKWSAGWSGGKGEQHSAIFLQGTSQENHSSHKQIAITIFRLCTT
jgi:hypothetical protein